ncbi:MAG: hypothetical protein DRO88_03945 [Promethearchaeia archaeon]|nr:MAG: hypothetical protein DRO88_03945 [Candidatus Lokiarchaeia archaeon]
MTVPPPAPPPSVKKSPNSEKKKKREDKQQTEELKDLLHKIDSDGAPKLKVSTSIPELTQEELEELEISKITKLHLQESPLRKDESAAIYEQPTGNLWRDIGIFFSQLGRAYENRYALWESTFVSLMKILKKMRKYNAFQTKKLITTINELELKITKGLQDFVTKRDEMERFTDVDYKSIAFNFKRSLELLHLQIQEIQIRQELDQLYQIYVL